MRWDQNLESISQGVGRELRFYRLLLTHEGTPWIARVVVGLALAYAVSPIDLIPDWFPLIGQLDDLLVVPALVWLGRRLVPAAVIAECRDQASDRHIALQPVRPARPPSRRRAQGQRRGFSATPHGVGAGDRARRVP